MKVVQQEKLKSFLLERAKGCIHEPLGQLAYRFVTPSYGIEPGADDHTDQCNRTSIGHYMQMYDWDACFFSQASIWLDDRQLPLDVVQNFLTVKTFDGHIPRTVSPGKFWDLGDHCKPFLCQSLEHACRNFPETKITTEILQSLKHYLDFFEAHRRHESGLFHWRNVLESGVDNNLSLIGPGPAAKEDNISHVDFPDGRLLAVDFNVYMALEYRAFANLSLKFGDTILADKYENKAVHQVLLIETLLWNEEKGLYFNRDPKFDTFVEVLSWTSLCPVMAGLSPAERALPVIENYMLNEEHFLRPAGIASLAQSELLYNQSYRGLYGRAMVSNWQGPMWVLPNVLAVRGLKHYGLEDKAKDVSIRVLETMAKVLAQNDTLTENYDAETGKPLWAPQFISWNILALELMELI